jgi:hypothetical protein
LVVDFEGNSRSIEEIEVGDYVLAQSEFDAAGTLELKRVEEKFVRVAPVMELVVRGQVITTTAEHPFYVAGEERFVPAGELTLDDRLVDSQGGSLAIDAIRVTDRLITVYNLRVADFHTYFVGGKLWKFDAWVHNAGKIDYVGGVKAPKGTFETLTHRNGVFEVVTQQGISGTTRGAHRASANRALLEAIDCDPNFARQLGEILGVDDVAAYMRSGRSGLLNPPGTEWHHPIQNPAVMQLLRREVHRHPELQAILHPDNIGGFGTHFGN